MNAHALLTSQGWRGKGHSLHATSDDIGLTHHILIKRNQDGSGLGSKKDHKAEAWWLNAFDQALKGIDVKSGTMKQTLKGGDLEKITGRTSAATKYTGVRGLYTSFVRGGVMDGSVNDPSATLLPPTPPESGASTDSEGKKKEKKQKNTKNTKKEGERESKEQRRARREAKRIKKAEEESARKDAEEHAAKKVEKKRVKKAERQANKERLKASETREERRVRRDARRKRKEDKRRLRAMGG